MTRAARTENRTEFVDERERWKAAHAGVVPPNEPLGRAWTYLRNHWDILAVVVQDVALELDNGEVERVIRGAEHPGRAPMTPAYNISYTSAYNGLAPLLPDAS